jgi:hypothetical protein
VDKSYRHQQLVPAAVWPIPHGLEKRPTVQSFNSAGDEIIGDIEHIDDDNLTITFSVPEGGEAYCN